MIKGLDDDEIEFLDLVDRTKLAADRIKNLEEEKELNDYRNRVATLHEKSYDEKIHSDVNIIKPKTASTNKSSQTNLLKGVVIKTKITTKRKLNDEDNGHVNNGKVACLKPNSESNGKESDSKPGLTCIGILPGLGYYNDTSSEEDSSDSDYESPVKEQMDMLGRKLAKKEKES